MSFPIHRSYELELLQLHDTISKRSISSLLAIKSEASMVRLLRITNFSDGYHAIGFKYCTYALNGMMDLSMSCS